MPNFPGYGTPQAPIDPFVNPARPMKPGQPAINPASIPNPNPTNNNMIGGFNNMDPRVGRTFPRPATMPSPGIPMKGQYRQGLPGGPGGWSGLGRQVQQMPLDSRQGKPAGFVRPGEAIGAGLKDDRGLHPMQAALQAWLAGMPQGGDPAAFQAWIAQRPDFGGGGGGGMQGPPTLPGRDNLDMSKLMGGSQRGGIPFGGFKAKGGHSRANTAYVVGEEGPEVVVPETDSTIIPSSRLRSGGHSGGGGGTRTPTTPTPTPTTPDTWENAQYGVNEYGGKGRIPGESIQDYFKRNMLAVLRGHAAAGDFGTPTSRPGTTPPPGTPPPGGSGAIPLPPATGGTGVGGGPMSPGMAFTLNNMRPMRGFQFPNYTQTWAMNPDVFGRTY